MKNTQDSKNPQKRQDDLLPEYDFDYNKANRNRFVLQQDDHSLTVKLEPDVAKVFKTSEDVNKALRAILSAIPS